MIDSGDQPIRLEQTFAIGMGFATPSPLRRDVIAAVVQAARLPDRLAWECRPETADVFEALVRAVQEATWDGRILVKPRSAEMAGAVCPGEFPALVGCALDLGLAQRPLHAGPLVEMLRELRRPVRDRLGGIAADLLMAAIAAGLVEPA